MGAEDDITGGDGASARTADCEVEIGVVEEVDGFLHAVQSSGLDDEFGVEFGVVGPRLRLLVVFRLALFKDLRGRESRADVSKLFGHREWSGGQFNRFSVRVKEWGDERDAKASRDETNFRAQPAFKTAAVPYSSVLLLCKTSGFGL